MAKNIDNIQIVEPPIGELTKKRGGFARACMTGCGCLTLCIVIAVVGIKLLIGPGPKTLKQVPESFPANIPVYDKDSIDTITYISGRYKYRGMQVASIFPKIILAPLLLNSNSAENTTSSPATLRDSAGRFWNILTTPVSDKRNTVEIEWNNVNTEPNFFVSYYKNELRKAGYQIAFEKMNTQGFNFSNDNGVSGTLLVSDTSGHAGTDYASLTINYPENVTATTEQ